MKASGPAAGWSWLVRGINTGRRNPGAVFGAAGLLALCGLAPSAVQLLLQATLKPAPAALLALMGAMMLVAAVLYPLLCGGFLQVIDAAEAGRPTRATALFAPFRRGRGGGQLVLLGVCLLLVYLAALALVMLTVGRGLGAWYLQVLAQAAAGGAAGATPPTLPSGFGATFALLLVFGLFYSGVYAIGMGQAALGGRDAMQALRDGFVGAARNLLPMLVLAVCGLVAGLVAALLAGLLIGVVALLAGLLSKVLALALVVPLYVALIVVLYAMMFGVMHAMWRDVAAAPAVAA
ncbi:MAG TPA: hypothetical protein VLM17_07475 [Xanthomonadaceae bacterium]|nr:hypothetical protein [Xanthomonadaceae bacterium]